MGRLKKSDDVRRNEYEKKLNPYLIGLLKEWNRWWIAHNFEIEEQKDGSKKKKRAKDRTEYDAREEVEYFIRATKTFQDEVEKVERLKKEKNRDGHDFKINLFAINDRLATVGCELDEKKLKFTFYDANSIFYSEELPPHLSKRYFLYKRKDQFINPIWGIFSKDKEIQKESEHFFKLKILPSLHLINHNNLYIEKIVNSWLFKFYASKNKGSDENQESVSLETYGMDENYKIINQEKYIKEMKRSQGLNDLLNFSFEPQDLYIWILRSLDIGIDRIIEDKEIYFDLLNDEGHTSEIYFSSKKDITTRCFKICSFLGQEGIKYIDERQLRAYKEEKKF